MQNDRFLKALRREPVDHTPIWIMRQAGRYLPEYRAVRAQAGDFLTLCKTPELAMTVTLQPIERFNLDAAIIFSDILTIPDAMGLGLEFHEGEGPSLTRPIRTAQDVQQLRVPEPNTDLAYVLEAIRLTQQALAQRVPLIGFSGSPWTLAAYMVEGGGSKTFSRIKNMIYQAPALLEQLLATLTQAVIAYLKAQILAGVDAIQIFDTWGGLLSPAAYQRFSLRPITEIVAALKKDHPTVPVIVFSKGVNTALPAIADSGCDAIGVDWTVDLAYAKAQVGGRVALQGNLDPCILAADSATIIREAHAILSVYQGAPGHVFNLGHGITPEIDPAKVKVLVDAVHAFRALRAE